MNHKSPMISWPALMDFCSWVPTQKNASVVVRIYLSGGRSLCQWHPAVPTPAITAITPFACCLMQPSGSAIEGPCLAVCQHGDLPFSLEQLINLYKSSNLRELLPYQKKIQKPRANGNLKLISEPGWEMYKYYLKLKFEVAPPFYTCEPCCCKPMAYDSTTFRSPFMLLPYST